MRFVLASLLVSGLIAVLLYYMMPSHAWDAPQPSAYRVDIVLAQQCGYLYEKEERVLEFPVTTGKRGYQTPKGTFHIRLKSREHRSSIYGQLKDAVTGEVIRTGVDAREYRGNTGGVFEGTPMNYFMEFAPSIGIHVGELMDAPASHGCVRVSEEVGALLFAKLPIGTPVSVLWDDV